MSRTSERKSRLSFFLKVANILTLRGFGSGVAVLLTVLAARFMTDDAAAHFFVIFNITTIAAVTFRWGLDEMIIRRVAAAETNGNVASTVSALGQLSHRRVLRWTALAALVAGASALIPMTRSLGIGPLELAETLTISALIALTASAGRMQQGLGRNNRAVVILNIAVPGMALLGLLTMVGVGIVVSADRLLLAYVVSAAAVYTTTVWIGPVAGVRPLPRVRRDHTARSHEKADVEASRRLGWVVLSQQALNWGALLIIPVAYGGATYTSFMVNFRFATLISLVMLAVNFTVSSQIATLHTRGEILAMRSLTRSMLLAVTGASAVAATALFLARNVIYDYARVDQRLSVVLAALVAGQVFFAISAVFAVVITMCRDEAFLMRVQGALTAVGLALFAALSFTVSLEVACLAFPVTYGILSVILGRRVYRTVLATPRVESATEGDVLGELDAPSVIDRYAP